MVGGRWGIRTSNIQHSTSNIKSKGTVAVMSAAVGRDDALRPKRAQPFRRLYRRGHRGAMSLPVVLAMLTGAESRSRGSAGLFGLDGEFHEPAFVQGQFQVQRFDVIMNISKIYGIVAGPCSRL
jgi:hypothetical protein